MLSYTTDLNCNLHYEEVDPLDQFNIVQNVLFTYDNPMILALAAEEALGKPIYVHGNLVRTHQLSATSPLDVKAQHPHLYFFNAIDLTPVGRVENSHYFELYKKHMPLRVSWKDSWHWRESNHPGDLVELWFDLVESIETAGHYSICRSQVSSPDAIELFVLHPYEDGYRMTIPNTKRLYK